MITRKLATFVAALGMALVLLALLLPGPQLALMIFGGVQFAVAFGYQAVTEWREARAAEAVIEWDVTVKYSQCDHPGLYAGRVRAADAIAACDHVAEYVVGHTRSVKILEAFATPAADDADDHQALKSEWRDGDQEPGA